MYKGPRLSELVGRITEDELQRLEEANITRCRDLADRVRDPVHREELAEQTGIPADRLLVIGALARCQALVMPGGDAIRQFAEIIELHTLSTQESYWPERLLMWDPTILVDYTADWLWTLERGQKIKATIRSTTRLLLVGAGLLAVLLVVTAWTGRGFLFPSTATDSLGLAANAYLRRSGLLVLGSTGGAFTILWISMGATLVGLDLLSLLFDWLKVRLLRLRGILALTDLSPLPHEKNWAHRLADRPVFALVLGIGLAIVAILYALGRRQWLAEAVLVTTGLGLAAYILVHLIAALANFQLKSESWIVGIKERWTQFEVFYMLIFFSYLLAMFTFLWPLSFEMAHHWLDRQTPQVEANAAAFERQIREQELSSQEREDSLNIQDCVQQYTQSSIDGLTWGIEWTQTLWHQIRLPLVLVIVGLLTLVVLGLFFIARSGRGVVLTGVWLLLCISTEFVPDWLENVLPVPSDLVRLTLFSLSLPLVLAIASDFFFAHLETGRTEVCPVCDWPMSTGAGICAGCGYEPGR